MGGGAWMRDLLVLLLIAIFFAVAWLYVRFCQRLSGER
jgi:hypothetical protein